MEGCSVLQHDNLVYSCYLKRLPFLQLSSLKYDISKAYKMKKKLQCDYSKNGYYYFKYFC